MYCGNLPPEGEVEQVEQGDGQHERLPVPQEEGQERHQHVAQGEAHADCQGWEKDPDSARQYLSTLERTQKHNTNRATQLPVQQLSLTDGAVASLLPRTKAEM